MPPTLKVKHQDAAIRQNRKRLAGSVIQQFGKLPDNPLLVFLDDQDWSPIKQFTGSENRGIYIPIKPNFNWSDWPYYVNECILVDNPPSPLRKRILDDLIYLRGGTCDDDVGLTMTLADELQHFVQHSRTPKLWAANHLLPKLDDAINAMALQWADFPAEREARVVAKRIAERIWGRERVQQYIGKRLSQAVTPTDVADWQFIQTVSSSEQVDLADATKRIFQRLRSYRPQLKEVLRDYSSDPDFQGIDLFALTG